MAKEAREPFRAGDHVQVHNPDGTPYEKWLLAADEYEGRVICCGYPEATAPAENCTLIRRATDEGRLDLLKIVATHQSTRGEWARRDLGRIIDKTITSVLNAVAVGVVEGTANRDDERDTRRNDGVAGEPIGNG